MLLKSTEKKEKQIQSKAGNQERQSSHRRGLQPGEVYRSDECVTCVNLSILDRVS